MIHPINESEKNRIKNLHREHFILNEQPGMGDGPWDLSREVEAPTYLNLTNQDYTNLNFDKGSEETRRIDIENNKGFVKTEQLKELSRFPNLEVLHIGGGFVQSVPAEAITPNLTFLSLPGTAIGSLPVEEIANSNIKVLNIRMTRDSISPEDIKFIRENGIDVIT